MKYTKLGNIDFDLSVIGFGGASISGEGKGYGFGLISTEESIDLVNLAFEKGINLFDTAPIYGFRESEKRLGMALKDKREKAFIVSKSGVSWHENMRVDMNNDPKIASKMLEQSLIDLQTDYIDLYMIHWPDEKWDIRKTLEVYQQAKDAGKIKHIGLCNTNLSDYEKSKEVCEVEVLQSQCNAFTLDNYNTLAGIIENDNLGFMSWGTLDQGILTGRVTKDRKFSKEDARGSGPWWNQEEVNAKIDKVDLVKEKLGAQNLLSFAIWHNLSLGHLDVCLCGARNPDQLQTILDIIENPPSKEDQALYKQILNG